MFKIATFDFNTFAESLAKIANDGRSLFYRYLVLYFIPETLFQDGPHQAVHCVDIWHVWQPNIQKLQKPVDWADASEPSTAEV